MAPSNSHVEVYLDLTTCLVGHDPLGTSTSKDLSRDIETLRSRTSEEGLSFLTKALPTLGKALDRGLITGQLVVPRGWKLDRTRSRPAFMQAYFSCLFGDDGALLDEPDPAAVKHLRQVLFLSYKLEVPYSKKEESIVVDNFIRTDAALGLDSDTSLDVPLVETASYIARDIFRVFDPKDIFPQHGPGAVASGERLDAKWRFSRLYRGIHQKYPYYDYFVAGGAREIADRLGWYRSLQRLETGTAKVVLVPKDSRGPRLISAEPLEYQWIQQGLGRKLARFLESHWLTGGQVNFTDQTINQRLALESSRTREFATLDLKDASDRVSLALVRKVFQHTPELLACLEACRTTSTKLPDGSVIDLKKFAPMGSALCFPVEALIFWVVIVAAVYQAGLSPRQATSREDLRNIGKQVFVYGDDIVVPTDWALVSMQALESVGLVVNRDKSCITGYFRESCGTDAFRGVVVTPARVRTPWTGHRSDGAAYASWVSLGNLMVAKGYPGAFRFIRELVERAYGKVPYGTSNAAYPCWIVERPAAATAGNRGAFRARFSSDYQRVEFYVPRVIPRRVDSALDDWPRLLRNLVSGVGEEPSKIVVPRSIRIKRGWTPVF